MTGSIRFLKPARLGYQEARNLPTLVLTLAAWLLLAALLPAVGLARGEEAAASALLQSDTASPATGPITATTGITETPLFPALITLTATFAPTDAPTPTEPPSTAEPTATWTPTPLPAASPEPVDIAQTGSSSNTRRHYVRGDSNVVLQWGILVDSLALGISYAWLIIGVLVGAGLPILFVVLWVRTRRRRSTQE